MQGSPIVHGAVVELRAPGTEKTVDDRKFDYFFLEALRQKNSGNFTGAFLSLQHCLSIDSTSAVAHYEISNYYLYLKRADLVLDHLEKAVRYSNDNFDYKIALANVSRELGMNEEAAKAYEDLIRNHPDKPELNYYLSDIYAKKGEIEKAIQALDVLEENIGMNEALSIQKYRLYLAIEKQAEANNEIQKLVAKFPMESKYSIMMGDLYLEQNEPEKAYEYYQKAYQIDPGNPYYIVSMANYYEYIGDKEAARQQVNSALQNAKLDFETKLGILVRYVASLQRDKKGMEGLDALFKTLQEQHPQEMDLNMLYGNYLMTQGRVEDAKFQYQVVTEMAPSDEDAWKQLLAINLKENNMDECIRICQAAQMHFPDMPDFYFYEGVSYYQKKEYARALSIFQKGLTFVPEEDTDLLSDFYGQIGDLYFQMKEKDKAYASYDTALKYNAKNAGILNNYAYFLSLDKKDLDRAERMSAQCVLLQPDNSTFLDTYAWVFFVKGDYSMARFYLEGAISKGGAKSPEIIDHYGDALYMSGEKEKAVEQWKKALELGKDTEILRKKIADGVYYEETE